MKINLISYFLRYSWLARPALNTATLHVFPVNDWLGWSEQVQKGHSSCLWHLCGALYGGPPTCTQSPECTLSTDIWCATENKLCWPWSMQEKCPLMLICPLGVVMEDESRTTWFIVCRAPNVRRQCTLGRLGVG